VSRVPATDGCNDELVGRISGASSKTGSIADSEIEGVWGIDGEGHSPELSVPRSGVSSRAGSIARWGRCGGGVDGPDRDAAAVRAFSTESFCFSLK
jgi:hypothetical protein